MLLTPKEQALYECLATHIRSQGRPPRLREIAGQFGYRSINGAAHALRSWQAKGFIRRTPGAGRGMQLTESVTPEMAALPSLDGLRVHVRDGAIVLTNRNHAWPLKRAEALRLAHALLSAVRTVGPGKALNE
jgi:SOS-response transcriptional repressor LexA